MTLEAAQRDKLFAIARESIEAALPRGELAPYRREHLPLDLLEQRSSFVTLRVGRELRGCCGTLDAPRPLAEDVWHNAWASAFNDPRFPPLSTGEWARVGLHISVLSNPEPVLVDGEQDLLRQLRPCIDGLILELGAARATFLPSVWQQIEDPVRFVRQLKLKAGWAADFWSRDLRISRYVTESFAENRAAAGTDD